ncbi:MAG: HEAT repeat domain-containing protein [Phycisphaerales bacterium]
MPARAAAIVLALGTALLPACRKPPEGFESPAPDARLRAISKAAESSDRASVPHLIEMLGSDDPLVRMAAIHALEDLTGQTLGYEHWAPAHERREALQRWLKWNNPQAQPGAAPAGTSADGGITDIPDQDRHR